VFSLSQASALAQKRNEVRNFTSFSAAAEEAGLSRIYAGQHFRTDHIAGKTLDKQVAESIDSSILRQGE
jgi:hypothetical protein